MFFSYRKNAWVNGDVITAAQLNNMGNGIKVRRLQLFLTIILPGILFYAIIILLVPYTVTLKPL